jgi:HK97 gp10 family phage protein
MQDEGLTVDVSSAIAGLKDLETKVAKKYVRKALRAAAKPTLAAAKATAPVGESGELQRAVKLKSGGIKKGIIRIIVGVGKKWFTGPTFYAAFVAMGHKVGKRDLGDSRKQVAPNEWLENAYKENAEGAITIFETMIVELIDGGE